MPMTKTLLELAREATPGPWTVTDNSWEVSTIYGSDRKAIAECHIDPEVTEYNQATLEKITTANAAFIAAANPQRIIELCEALEGLLNCPVIADGDINSADWGCPESAAAVARACRALKGE